MNRDEWLEWRRGGLGSSDVAAVLGVSPYASPWDVWLSKTQGIDLPDNAAMEVGRYMERGIGEWAADQLGGELIKADPVVGTKDWMRSTPDFMVAYMAAGAHATEILECKKARQSADEWGEAGSDLIPVDYTIQVQWQMLCKRRRCAYLAVLFTLSDEFRLYTIERDEKLCAHLEEAAGAWWQRHVIEGNPPELDGSKAASRWLAEHYATNEDIRREADEDEQATMRRLRLYLERRKRLDEEIAIMKQDLIRSMGGQASKLTSPFGSVSYKSHDRKSIDTKRLRAEHPEIAEACTRVSSVATFRTNLKE